MFSTVFTQVCVLMILITVGFIFAKAGLLTKEGVSCCTDIALIISTPCVIIKSLIREYDKKIMTELLKAFALTLLVQVLLIVLSHILIHSKNIKRKRVLRFGSIFANCGFMSLPLQEVLLGADGTLYGSAYIIMFNLVIWSYGIFLISGDKSYIKPKKLLINPGIVGLLVGMIIFVFSIPIPKIIYSPINYLAAIYTPLPMLIIGYHLAQTNVLYAFKDIRCIAAVLLRLFVYPFAALGLLFLLGVRGTLLVSIVISVSAPVAALTTMFSAKTGGDVPLSVDMVSLSTVLSLVSMPLIITAAQHLANL